MYIKSLEYEFVFDSKGLIVYRNGERFSNETGNNALLSLMERIEDLENKLSEAEGLLSEAHDMLDDVHCYNTDLYREISVYFNGDKEE